MTQSSTNQVQVQIRNEKGEVFNTVNQPAVLFDKSCGTMHKIGEYDTLLPYFDQIQAAYRNAGFPEMAEHMTLLELPHDQELIDRIFQSVDYVGRWYNEQVKAGVIQ